MKIDIKTFPEGLPHARPLGEGRRTTTTTTTVPWWHGGVGKTRFEQSTSTHSGAGEKETLNINVVGKTRFQAAEVGD